MPGPPSGQRHSDRVVLRGGCTKVEIGFLAADSRSRTLANHDFGGILPPPTLSPVTAVAPVLTDCAMLTFQAAWPRLGSSRTPVDHGLDGVLASLVAGDEGGRAVDGHRRGDGIALHLIDADLGEERMFFGCLDPLS